MSGLLIEELQFVKDIDPVADAHNAATEDVFDMSEFERLVFGIYRGVATGGTAAPTITVLACDDTTPTNTTAIPFHYRLNGGAVALATAAGVQLAAGSSKIDLIEVREDMLASTGYRYVKLVITETVNDPVVACGFVVGKRKYAGSGAYPTVTD